MNVSHRPATFFETLIAGSKLSRLDRKAFNMSSTPPILEITDGKGNLLSDAFFTVLATMFHPDNPEQRRRFLEAPSAIAQIEIGAPILWKSIPAAAECESVLDQASDAGYGMTVSGDLLLFIMSAARHSPKDASVARAIWVWCEDQARGKTHEGRAVAASPRSLKAAWSRFKPVAHLCGAWRNFTTEQIVALDLTNLQTLLNFLALAEALRGFGESHHPPSGRAGGKSHVSSTLDPMTTWRTPTDLRLSSLTLDPAPLTEFARKVLRNYRAE